MSGRGRLGPAVLVAAVVAAAPAAADWLVMRDGSRVESKGPWEVRGAVVVLSLPSGALSSVRVRDVDLEASKAATEEAARPPAPTPTPAPPKKPTIVLTDADVGHVDDIEAPEPIPPGARPALAATPAPSVERIVVGAWHQDLEDSVGGATLVGELTNNSVDLVQDVQLLVSIYDEKGKSIADVKALVGATTLLPGQGTNFRANFPGVYHFATAKFAPGGYARKVAGPPPPGA